MKRNKNHPDTPGNKNEPTSFLKQHNFSGNLSLEDLRELYKQMEKEQILSSYTFPAKPSSDGYYHVYLSAAGGRKQIKAKNLEKLKEKVYEYEKGVNGSTRKTFKDVFEAVQQEKLVYVKDEEKLVSVNNTICTVRSNYKRFFEGTAFETMFIDEISKTDIEKHCFAVLKKMDLKKRAFMNMRNILSSAFKLAYEQYWIFDNPYTRIDFKKYNDMLAKDTAVHMRVHSSEDIDRMLDFLHRKQASKPWYIPAYALELQIIMGLRRGEIAPLRWSDVKKNSIRICREQLTDKSNKGFVIVDHTKTYKDREFPLTTTLSEFIARLRAVHDEFYPASPYLFPDVSQKNKVINNRVVYRLYERMCRKLDIEISCEFIKGPHSFRRNGITHVCNASGGNIYLASVLYGNSPQSASMHYYTGINLSEAKALLEGKQGNQRVTKGNQKSG